MSELKKARAFDIIVKKNVDIALLRRSSDVNNYNKNAYQRLEEDEFRFLKELIDENEKY